MRKKALLFSAALALIGVGCKENAYMTYENDAFRIDYPKSWDADDSIFEVVPFAAYANATNQMVSVRTRLLDSVAEGTTLEEFVQDRIEEYKNDIIGFNLQKQEAVEDGIIIHYTSGIKDSEMSNFYNIVMKYGLKDNKFYGACCEAANEAELDTAEHIVKSFCLK